MGTARRRISHYELLGPIGRDGPTEIFRARDLRLDREVAIKLLRPEEAARPGALDRFRREARIASLVTPSAYLRRPRLRRRKRPGVPRLRAPRGTRARRGDREPAARDRARARHRLSAGRSARGRAPAGHRPRQRQAVERVHHDRRARQAARAWCDCGAGRRCQVEHDGLRDGERPRRRRQPGAARRVLPPLHVAGTSRRHRCRRAQRHLRRRRAAVSHGDGDAAVSRRHDRRRGAGDHQPAARTCAQPEPAPPPERSRRSSSAPCRRTPPTGISPSPRCSTTCARPGAPPKSPRLPRNDISRVARAVAGVALALHCRPRADRIGARMVGPADAVGAATQLGTRRAHRQRHGGSRLRRHAAGSGHRLSRPVAVSWTSSPTSACASTLQLMGRDPAVRADARRRRRMSASASGCRRCSKAASRPSAGRRSSRSSRPTAGRETRSLRRQVEVERKEDVLGALGRLDRRDAQFARRIGRIAGAVTTCRSRMRPLRRSKR